MNDKNTITLEVERGYAEGTLYGSLVVSIHELEEVIDKNPGLKVVDDWKKQISILTELKDQLLSQI